jgi:hypothetical protein
MAAPLFPGRQRHTGRRGLSIIECLLALSVIVGFLFVTVRVMSFGLPTSWNQAAATDTAAAKTETPQLASETSDTKTP